MIVGKDGHPVGVDEEREAIPSQQRILDICCACRLLQREGFGQETPNHIVEAITRVFQNRQ